MKTYKNWIPIHFGEENIVLWKAGFSGETFLKTEQPVWKFSTKGIEYHWPESPEGLPLAGERINLAPGDSPELTKAILGRMIKVSMAPLLISSKEAGEDPSTWEIELKEIKCRISLHSQKGYQEEHYLVILPLEEAAGANLFRATRKLARALAEMDFDNGAGTKFKLLPHLESEENDVISNFQDPELNFRPGGTLTHRSKWSGLKNYGPLTIESFRDKTVECLVFAPRNAKGLAGRMIGELREGLPQGRKGTFFPWPDPWSQIFQMKGMNMQEVLYHSDDPGSFRDLCAEAIKSSPNKPDLAFVMVDGHEGFLSPEQDPYVLFKAELLKYGLPSQMIRRETCQLPEFDRAKALRNIALGAYVKMGGRPWLLPRQKFMVHELVIGVGATPLREGVAGFSMIFTRDGDFRLGNSSIRPGIGDWQAALGDFVSEQIRQLAKEAQWEDSDQVDLTFHFAEELKMPDVKGIRDQLIARFKDRFKLKCTFLFLRQNHDFRIWDPEMPGVGKGENNTGEYQPRRGNYIVQDDENAFLQLHKPEDEGLFNPFLQIFRHPDSDNFDLGYLGEQIFRFSSISWRSMGHSTLPATLEYGNALTRLLEKFDRAGLRPEVETSLISHPQKTWFL